MYLVLAVPYYSDQTREARESRSLSQENLSPGSTPSSPLEKVADSNSDNLSVFSDDTSPVAGVLASPAVDDTPTGPIQLKVLHYVH